MGERESGAAAAEYGVLLAAVAVMIVFVASALGLVSAQTIGSVSDAFGGSASSVGGPPPQALGAPAPTLDTTVRAGRPCREHGAYAHTADGTLVQCKQGQSSRVHRWRPA